VLTIADGGTVAAQHAVIYSGRRLVVEVSNGSGLVLDGGSGTLDNNGSVRIIAGPTPAPGAVYAPISAGTWGGSGTYQALGGTWDAVSHEFTASAVKRGTSGTPVSIDPAVQQRVMIDDPTTGWSVGASLLVAGSSGLLDFQATALTGTALGNLESLLDGDSVLGAWSFSDNAAYFTEKPAYLSFEVGPGYAREDLTIWCTNAMWWAKLDTWALVYDGTYVSFTTEGSRKYAVTGPEASMPTPGDANDDGVVNHEDAALLAAHWLQAGAGWGGGDFNDDGVVDDLDASILAAHWIYGAGGAAVPEPSTLSLLAALTLLGPLHRGTRRKQRGEG